MSPPREIARLLARIVEDPAPRLRYMAGSPVQGWGAWLKPSLPGRLFAWFMMTIYGLRQPPPGGERSGCGYLKR